MMRLSDIGEDELIRRLVACVPSGEFAEEPGDDCAVVDHGGARLELLKTDGLVEGVHFLAGAEPGGVGWKAIARVISDFAAMGGVAERFLVTVALPGAMEVGWIEGFYRGMGECMRAHGGVLVGGETCRVPEGSAAVISVAGTGWVERGGVVLRSGGRPGDEIWVTGRLGGSLAGKHFTFAPRVEEARWLVGHFQPRAMMDVSDGLAKDLGRLAAASGCGFKLDLGSIPRTEGCSVEEALGDGEDFELLFAAPRGRDAGGWGERFPELELTRIGEFVGLGEGDDLAGGWDHFA